MIFRSFGSITESRVADTISTMGIISLSRSETCPLMQDTSFEYSIVICLSPDHMALI